MKILNYTGRTIALFLHGSWTTFFSDGHCKLDENLISVDCSFIEMKTYEMKSILNLPEKKDGVLIVVDKEVAIQAWRELRDDVVYMHCPLIRDDKYNSLASFTLIKWRNSYIRMNCT